ncbi:MAG: hypothetical protein CME68_05730 [Halobacteriovoraceae bacterium]|nr:hypothetical protein [Halobacteriovoraceae bacterium]
MRILFLNLLFFACFFGLKVLVGDALANNSLFFGKGLNKHVVYEYRFNVNNPNSGKFYFIRKELR